MRSSSARDVFVGVIPIRDVEQKRRSLPGRGGGVIPTRNAPCVLSFTPPRRGAVTPAMLTDLLVWMDSQPRYALMKDAVRVTFGAALRGSELVAIKSGDPPELNLDQYLEQGLFRQDMRQGRSDVKQGTI